MIYLQQGNINQPTLVTCSRNKTLTGAVTYLWTIRHKLSQQSWKFIPYRSPNITTYEPSKDLFYISVNENTPEVFIGNITTTANLHLIPGEYYIKIYEQTSTTNLNPAHAYDVVYEGMLIVKSDDPINQIAYTGNSEVIIIYQQ
jgi:hypothetical protein